MKTRRKMKMTIMMRTMMMSIWTKFTSLIRNSRSRKLRIRVLRVRKKAILIIQIAIEQLVINSSKILHYHKTRNLKIYLMV